LLNKVFKISTIWGVPIKVHWSFLLLIALIAYLFFLKQLAINQLLNFVLLLFVLFVCVLIHEMGHAVIAKSLGIKAKDIVLSPIGGLARIESMEKYPRKEILIALAGPLTNLILAALVFVYLFCSDAVSLSIQHRLDLEHLGSYSMVYFFLYVNLLLCFFNLIPAFPMDGGRILRAVLSLKYDSLKATYIASLIGKILAIGFIVYAIVSSYYIIIPISVFVFLMASNEYAKLKVNKESELV